MLSFSKCHAYKVSTEGIIKSIFCIKLLQTCEQHEYKISKTRQCDNYRTINKVKIKIIMTRNLPEISDRQKFVIISKPSVQQANNSAILKQRLDIQCSKQNLCKQL